MDPWETIVLSLSIAVALALPLVVLHRRRTPEQRRDEWLSAIAQPRLAQLSYVLGIVLAVVGALVCTLVALAGYRWAWAVVALWLGLLAATVIHAVVASRPPRDLD